MNYESKFMQVMYGIMNNDIYHGIFSLIDENDPQKKLSTTDVSFLDITACLYDQKMRNEILSFFESDLLTKATIGIEERYLLNKTIEFLKSITKDTAITKKVLNDNFSQHVLLNLCDVYSQAKKQHLAKFKTELLNFLAANYSDEEACEKFQDLIKEDDDYNYGNKQEIVAAYNASDVDVLFFALANDKMECFNLLIVHGFTPFMVSSIPIIYKHEIFFTPFNFIAYLQSEADDQHYDWYLDAFLKNANNLSMAQIEHIPYLDMKEPHKLQMETIIREVFAKEIDLLNIQHELKDELKSFLNHPDIEINDYSLLDKLFVTEQLINYIKYPYTQDQGDQGTCGVNAIFISMAIHAPNALVYIALELLKAGKCRINNLNLKVNDHVKAKCNDLAKLFNQALKNAQPYMEDQYKPYSKFAELFADCSSTADQLKFLKQLGCYNIQCISNDRDTFKNDESNKYYKYKNYIKPLTYADIDSLIEQFANNDKITCIMNATAAFAVLISLYDVEEQEVIDNEMIKENNNPYALRMGHAAVLKSVKYNSQDAMLLDVNIYTYGRDIRLSIPKIKFELGLHEYITFEFPDNLKLLELKKPSLPKQRAKL